MITRLKRRYFFVALIALSLGATLASFTSIHSEKIVEDVLSLTNKFRRSKGLEALQMRDDLNEIARKHSENMARGRVGFGHGGFAKRQGQVKKLDHNASSFAENVAYGSTTAKDVVDGWKRSAGHRKNMLGAYKYIGIGIARDKRGVIYYTQVFVD
jgi:uncharacterized protein YkwD